MPTIIFQQVEHLAESLHLIWEFHILGKNVKIKPVNHCDLNLHNLCDRLIAAAPHVDGLLSLDWAWTSTKCSDIIDDSYLVSLWTAGSASRYISVMRILRHHRLPHIGLKPLEVSFKITNHPSISGKFNCNSWQRCKLIRKYFTPNTTACATDPLQLVHRAVGSPLAIAIEGWQYMLLSLIMPCALWMSIYWGTRWMAWRDSKNRRLLVKSGWVSKWNDFIRIEVVSIPRRCVQNTSNQKGSWR